MESFESFKMKILIYGGEGVALHSLKLTLRSLKQALPSSSILIIDHTFLIDHSWEDQTDLIVFPGGRDTPYHQKLRGKANSRIRQYVLAGGAYLGICAGAYYGCLEIEFEKGHPLEILESRELGFFLGKAIGPALGLGEFCYKSEKGAKAANIMWKHPETSKWVSSSIYYNGGCYFSFLKEPEHFEVLGYYCDSQLPAIIQCKVGKGQAILSGVHLEYSARDLLASPSLPFMDSLLAAENYRDLLWRSLLNLITQKNH